MRITVFGASGLIGSQVVELLTAAGHDVVGASLRTGANVLTGEGLAEACHGADVLIDVTNSPSFEDEPVMAFFTASSTNLVQAARSAGVGHYVALSIVGTDGLPDSGYLRAKVAQERIITDSGLPHTIVRATQFHEFGGAITDSLRSGDVIHAPDGRIQPIASAEVAAELARVAQQPPVNGIVNIGGPEKLSFADLVRAVLAQRGEDTPVVIDPAATYFGTVVDQDSLVTGPAAVLAQTRFTDWLATQ